MSLKSENDLRIERETKISHKVVDCLLKAGLAVSIYDGEVTTVNKSTNREEIIKALWTSDEDILTAWQPPTQENSRYALLGRISLIYGNDCDLISDYHLNLETILKPAEDLANELEV